MLLLSPWKGERGCHRAGVPVPHGRTDCMSDLTRRFMPLELQGLGKSCFCMACLTQALFVLAVERRAKINYRRLKGMVSQIHKMPSTLPKHIMGNFMWLSILMYNESQFPAPAVFFFLRVCVCVACDNFCVEFEIIYVQYTHNYDIYKQKRTRFLDSAVGFFLFVLCHHPF